MEEENEKNITPPLEIPDDGNNQLGDVQEEEGNAQDDLQPEDADIETGDVDKEAEVVVPLTEVNEDEEEEGGGDNEGGDDVEGGDAVEGGDNIEVKEPMIGGDEPKAKIVEDDDEGGDGYHDEVRVEVAALKGASTSPGKLNRNEGEPSFNGEDFDEEDDDEEIAKGKRFMANRQEGKRRRFVEEYDPPNKEQIKAFVKKKRLYDSKRDGSFTILTPIRSRTGYRKKKEKKISTVSSHTELDVVSKLGPGVVSYFQFLRMFGIAFFLFGLIALPAILLNYGFGEALSGLSSLSVGNLFILEDILGNTSSVFTLGKNDQIEINRNFVLALNIVYDLVIVFLFLVLVEYSIIVFKKAELKYLRDSPNLESFSVELYNLPPEVKYTDLEDFFTNLVNERVYPRKRLEEEQQRNIPGGDTESIADYDPEPVFDVQLVTTTKDKLTFAIQHAKLKKKVENKYQKLGAAKKKLKNGKMSQLRYDAIEQEYDQAEEKFKNLMSQEEEVFKRREGKDKVIKAFVTFTNKVARDGVLEEYNKKLGANGFCNNRDEALMLDGYLLRVRAPIGPALVNWENMEYKKGSRRARNCCSLCFLAIILLISSISLTAIGAVENLDLFGSVLSDEQAEFVDLQGCDGDNVTLIDSDCSLVEEIDEDTEDDCVLSITCNCTTRIANADSAVIDDALCRQFLIEQAIDLAFLAGTGLIVTIFNIILEVIITFSVRSEKDHDKSKEDRKLYIRIFVATYINTAVVKLITNLDFRELFGVFEYEDLLPGPLDILLSGQFLNFDSGWYSAVGTELTVIAIGNIFGPHVFTLLRYWWTRLRRCCCPPLNEAEIEKLYLGPEFLLPLRYAQIVVAIFFTLTYSSGIPILYFTASLSCFLAYWVDKFFLFKFYRKPLVTNNGIVLWICRSLKFAIMLHVFFAIIIFSDPTLFPFDDDGSALSLLNDNDLFDQVENVTDVLTNPFVSRIITGPVILTTLTFVLLIVYQILMQFECVFKCVKRFSKKIIRCIFGCLFACFCFCCRRKSRQNELLDAVDELEQLQAEQRKLKLNPELLEVKSYCILAQDRYADNFILKEKQSFTALYNADDQAIPHTTEEVIRLLDFEKTKERDNKFIYEVAESFRSGKSKKVKKGNFN